MFTPLPTHAVTLTVASPDPPPGPPPDPPSGREQDAAARLAQLADALADVVPVHVTAASDLTGAPDAPVAGTGGAAAVVTPRTPAEVAYVVRAAREHGVPVAVPAGRHGAPVFDGALLVATAGLDHLTILPVLARAHVGPGVRWDELVAAAASFGLAPVAARPPVEVAGELVGTGERAAAGAAGPGADGVRALDVVTADGVLRRATRTDDAVLFEALHAPGDEAAGGRTPGVVVAMELDLEATVP
ncbi:MAG: FAD-dependent oxidoreductase [Cellulomonas sp.]|uniref:FAD-binding oxidoreductase n=1 Tax=Cellulomonas sp. TaxID=40001 RepID=UPI001A051A1E|nr:FAD-dependent oxidoreductase [Cellulomonas sp.]MBF0688223.1 FAD-dependent oxidoreductase [Cellulomonas sp.]